MLFANVCRLFLSVFGFLIPYMARIDARVALIHRPRPCALGPPGGIGMRLFEDAVDHLLEPVGIDGLGQEGIAGDLRRRIALPGKDDHGEGIALPDRKEIPAA
jgi:hypothetical protein